MRLTDACAVLVFLSSCGLSAARDVFVTIDLPVGKRRDQAARAISKAQLHALPRFHTPPIDGMVYPGSRGVFVLRGVSRLDAFSGYPVRT